MITPAYLHDHIVIRADGGACALYHLAGADYAWRRAEEKLTALSAMTRLHEACRADHAIHRVTRAIDTRGYRDEARAAVHRPHADHAGWEDQIGAHAQRLIGAWSVETYLAVDLTADAPASLGAGLLGAADAIRARLGPLLRRRRAAGPIAPGALAVLETTEAALAERLAGAVGAERIRPASPVEIQWLFLRAATRGLGEPIVDRHWRPDGPALVDTDGGLAEPAAGQALAAVLADCVITERERHLVIDTERGTSHQALLAMGALPETVEFPGAAAEALHHPLATLDIPVDATLHCGWIAPSKAIADVRRRVVDAHNQLTEESGSHTGATWQTQDAPARARELEQRLSAGERRPLLRVSASFALGGRSEAELAERVRALAAAYESRDIVLRRPAGLQRRLWAEGLPGAGRRVGDYARVLTPERTAALMPAAADSVGSRGGGYIGRVTQAGGRPVLFDPTEAASDARPPSVLLWGTLGSGKTIAAQLIALHAALRGARVCDIDPKPDHRLDALPELAGAVEVIELDADPRNQGALDPLVIAPEGAGEDLAVTYLSQLLPAAQAEAHATAIRQAVKAVIADGTPSCGEVVRRLTAARSREARRAGADLAVLADSGLARLGFAPAGQVAALGDRSVTCVRAAGLVLPDPATPRSDYTAAERVSVATLTLLAAVAMRIVASEPGRPKVVVFDEAWFLLESSAGRALVARLNRMGRAMGAAIILATQRIDDAAAIEDLVGTRLVFGLETRAEASRALALLGLDSDDEALIAAVRGQRRGTCLMRDVTGRVAQLQIDVAMSHVLDVLDTSPGAHLPLIPPAAGLDLRVQRPSSPPDAAPSKEPDPGAHPRIEPDAEPAHDVATTMPFAALTDDVVLAGHRREGAARPDRPPSRPRRRTRAGRVASGARVEPAETPAAAHEEIADHPRDTGGEREKAAREHSPRPGAAPRPSAATRRRAKRTRSAEGAAGGDETPPDVSGDDSW